MADRVGQFFGNYQLLRLLGSSAFADVYLAEHRYLETPAAIKVLYVRLEARVQEQFLREGGWMYLVAVLDWYSRSVVSWELVQMIQVAFVIEAMQRTQAQATPQICNSDQGSQFTNPQYTQLLLSNGVRISMDSKGRALDNIFMERLWRSVKYEEVYIKDYVNPREARKELREYLHFYNEQRVHQALDYRTPAEIYFART